MFNCKVLFVSHRILRTAGLGGGGGGGGGAGWVTVTFANVAVFSRELLCELTARPAQMFVDIEMAIDPNNVQFVPSLEP